MKFVHLSIAIGLLLTPVFDKRSLYAEEEAPRQAEQIATEMTDIFDLVLDHHVMPVTKQQMVHYCLAFSYLQAGRHMPANLVKEISETVDNDRFQDLLRRELLTLVEDDSQGQTGLAEGLAAIGAYPIQNKDMLVNQQLAANRYVGIGIAISVNRDKIAMMQKVFPGGPADQAGAQDHDLIIEVDGKSTAGVELTKTVEWLRGAEGTEVEILLQHDGADRSVRMTRGVVPMSTVRPPLFSDSGKTVGIALDRVSASSVHELGKIAANLDEKVTKVILDFRVRSGADHLHYGELLGNALLDGEPIGQVTDRRAIPRTVIAEEGSIFSGRELVVVIDSTTSGTLKWIAAAFQDSGQAIIYGDPTAVSAMTMEAIELNPEMSVVMPVQLLSRGNGELLSVNSQLLSPDGKTLANELRLLQAAKGKASQIKGILYPDKPFPHHVAAPNAVASAMPRSQQMSIRELKPLLNAIEKESSEATIDPRQVLER